MKKAMLFRVAVVLVAMIALGWLPEAALAQRGGHGGGGGFHGGGGGGFHGGGGGGFHGGGGFYGGGHSRFNGGRSYGGFRGGYYGGRGYVGGRGGYGWGGRGYGWGGRYWGRGYGYGWGWGFGFGWPYWGWGWGYPYGYYYSPGYYAPGSYYSYPYYGTSDDPTGYPNPGNGNDDPPPTDPNTRPLPNQNGPAKSWRPPVPGGAPHANYANSDAAAVAPRGSVLSVDRMSVTQTSYRAAGSIPAHFTAERATTQRATTQRATIERAAAQADAPLRPEVQKALQRLREMPPFAREREIETGRYRDFSSEEKQILRNGE
jgi:hypothetical protein